jgi:predicted Fe-Mo cluster-binding NifX family protein
VLVKRSFGIAAGEPEFASFMLIAVPNCQGRVSPVLDVASRLTIVDLKRRNKAQKKVALGDMRPTEIAETLVGLGTQILICEAVSEELEAVLVKAGIQVIPQICGEVEAVLRAYRTGRLGDPEYQMPGCCKCSHTTQASTNKSYRPTRPSTK